MKYFEFNKHEYWALVAADSVEKAYEVYAEEVAGDSAKQVKEEGEPKEIKQIEAAIMYEKIVSKDEEYDSNLTKRAKEFIAMENTAILITAELA
ncbi:hypothetical protein COK83_30430 [Bacillus thuringiensis]|uniref:hypothetical protein n=1 Tax=Bacillus cereus group TaxID=86661 RepID=UPI000BF9BB21|nr:hypothetical protein [Bacillus thuringiensis]MCQ6336982.1 hypothetical protein [Bacillus cereus]PFT04854.1 hypothetical protein COK83_30430 [Bacillus thuringiensis]